LLFFKNIFSLLFKKYGKISKTKTFRKISQKYETFQNFVKKTPNFQNKSEIIIKLTSSGIKIGIFGKHLMFAQCPSMITNQRNNRIFIKIIFFQIFQQNSNQTVNISNRAIITTQNLLLIKIWNLVTSGINMRLSGLNPNVRGFRNV